MPVQRRFAFKSASGKNLRIKFTLPQTVVDYIYTHVRISQYASGDVGDFWIRQYT
jgi:hypothetical protein